MGRHPGPDEPPLGWETRYSPWQWHLLPSRSPMRCSRIPDRLPTRKVRCRPAVSHYGMGLSGGIRIRA